MAEKIYIADKPTLDLTKGNTENIITKLDDWFNISDLILYDSYSVSPNQTLEIFNIEGRGKLKHFWINITRTNAFCNLFIDDVLVYSANSKSGIFNLNYTLKKEGGVDAVALGGGSNLTYDTPLSMLDQTNLPYTGRGRKFAVTANGIPFSNNVRLEVVNNEQYNLSAGHLAVIDIL